MEREGKDRKTEGGLKYDRDEHYLIILKCICYLFYDFDIFFLFVFLFYIL